MFRVLEFTEYKIYYLRRIFFDLKPAVTNYTYSKLMSHVLRFQIKLSMEDILWAFQINWTISHLKLQQIEFEIVTRTKSYDLRLVSLRIHWTDFFQWCLLEAISLNWNECLHAAKTTWSWSWTYMNSELVWFSALQVCRSYIWMCQNNLGN